MSDSKRSAWDRYRKWRKVALAVLPLTIYVFTSGASALVTLPLFVISAMAVIFIQFFECPKCHEPFFYISGFATTSSKFRFGGHRPCAQKCVHCGFPKWEEPPEKPEIYPIPRNSCPLPDPALAERLRLANFLTLVLRDDPKAIGLRLDANGWADVDDLLKRANRNDIKLTREKLDDVLTVSENHHFEWDQSGNRIRCSKS